MVKSRLDHLRESLICTCLTAAVPVPVPACPPRDKLWKIKTEINRTDVSQSIYVLYQIIIVRNCPDFRGSTAFCGTGKRNFEGTVKPLAITKWQITEILSLYTEFAITIEGSR